MIRHFDDPLAPAPLREVPHITQHALLTAGLPNSSMQMTYWALSRFADEDGDAQPLQQQIIDMLPDSESTIKRNLKGLKALGWLLVTEERWAFDGRRHAYHMTAGNDGFPIAPRDPANKPSSFQEALMDVLEGTRQELVKERSRNARLEESMRALADPRDVESLPSEGQIASGQIDPTKKEEGELSGQSDTDVESSSSSPNSPGSGHSESLRGPMEGNLTSISQPMLQVETIEPLEEPWITEMKEWVREEWSRLRYSATTNPDGFRAALPRVIGILTEKGEENYLDSRTHWEAVWAEQEEAASPQKASVPRSVEPVPDLPEIRISSVDHQAQDVWMQVLGDLELKMPAQYFETYLKLSVGYAWDVSDGQRCLVVAVRGSFVATWLERRVFGDITRALEAVAGEGITVRFEAGELVIGGPGDENGGTE